MLRFVPAAALAAFAGAAHAAPTVFQFDGNLTPASGAGSLAYFNGDGSFASLATDSINEAATGVLSFNAPTGAQGLVLTHAGLPNGGGSFVNRYTVVYDIKFTSDNWTPLWQTNTTNANDADLYRRGLADGGGLGISGQYGGELLTGTWYRVALVFDLAAANPNRLRKYINGVPAGEQTNLGGLDGRWSLDPTAILLTEPSGSFTGSGLLSSLLFDDRAYTPDEIAALGGPTAAGIAPPASVPPTVVPSTTPATIAEGAAQQVLLTAATTRGAGPAATTLTVAANLESIGGAASVLLLDNGLNGDVLAGDGVYSVRIDVPGTLALGVYTLPITVVDNLGRSAEETARLVIESASVGTNATQWDFSGGAAPLAASFGPGTLAFWERPGGGSAPGSTQADTAFGTTTAFEIPDIGGQPAQVMRTAQYFGDQGIIGENASPGNGGGIYVNRYTLVFDLLVRSSDVALTPFLPLYNTNDTNSNDADAYIDGAAATVGFPDLGYAPAGSFPLDAWNRVAIVFDAGAPATHRIFVNGAPVFSAAQSGAFEGRWALYSSTDGDVPAPMHFFTENTGNRTGVGFVNSLYYVDRPLSAAEVLALGSPDADGIVTPPTPINCNVADIVSIGGFPPADGELTVDDYTSFINAFAGDELLADIVAIGGFPPADGELTVDDYTSFINAFAEGC